MRVREYGTEGPMVVLLHGGPAAPGTMAPVARGLEDTCRVLEPMQRGSGATPLSVARHVADLHELLGSRLVAGERPVLVGSSWGAMLALAFAAEHPGMSAGLVLVGCGTFDPAARARFEAIRAERTDDALRARLREIEESDLDPDARLLAAGDAITPMYTYDPVTTELECEGCDALAHRETWADMLRLQASGLYPAAFARITEPVLMLHGAFDPHPGRLIEASLRPHVPQLEYVEWERCGHYPWIERHARDQFFAALRKWICARSA